MSKTTPARWWRDDADRYRSRGAYVAPERQWTIEQLAASATIRDVIADVHARMIEAAPPLGWTPRNDEEREKARRFAEIASGGAP